MKITLNRRSPLRSVITLLEGFGFTECSEINNFITYFCHPLPLKEEMVFIERKLVQCLVNHDDGGEYFIPLRHAYAFISLLQNDGYLRNSPCDKDYDARVR